METKSQITKEHILILSKEVFQRMGYTAVTMADIATATQMGRSSLYYYFKNKEEFFFAVAYHIFSEILDKAKSKIKSNQSFYDNFLAFNKERLNLLKNLAKSFEILLNDVRENPNILYSIRNVHMEKEFDIYKQILVWGLKRHDIAPISPEDLNFFITNLIHAFKGLEQEIFLQRKVDELMSRLEWVTSILSKGLK